MCHEELSKNLVFFQIHLLFFLPSAAKDLISRLLIVDRRKRYTAVDVLVHPWVITFAGSKHPPAPMDEHRRSLRAQLDSQAKSNKAEYLALTGKADKAT